MPINNEKSPVMATPVVKSGSADGHSNGDPQANIDKLVVDSPVTSPKPIVVGKNRSGKSTHDSTELTETKNTISRFETRTELSSRSQSRTTNITDNGTVRFNSDRQVLVLRETVINTKNRLIRGIEHVNEQYIASQTIDSFLEYIENERLTHMPHHGSRWDKVLKWAEFYALQIQSYQKVVSPFVQNSKEAAQLIWVACRLLLEVRSLNFLTIPLVP